MEEDRYSFSFRCQLKLRFLGTSWGREGLRVTPAALPVDLGCFVPSFLPPSHEALTTPRALRKVAALSHLVETEGPQP